MENKELLQAFSGALVVILGLFIGFAKWMFTQLDDRNKKIDEIDEMTKKMWSLHNNYDEDGSPKWFVKKSMVDDIKYIKDQCVDMNKDLDNFAQTQAQIFRGVSDHLETLNTLLRNIQKG